MDCVFVKILTGRKRRGLVAKGVRGVPLLLQRNSLSRHNRFRSRSETYAGVLYNILSGFESRLAVLAGVTWARGSVVPVLTFISD